MASFTLGINTGFASNRFPEPDVWARIVREELGLSQVQLVADLLNPFWPKEVIAAELARVREAVARYDITIHSLMTSTYTRVNHFMHPHAEQRRAWVAWFRRFAELAAELGVKAVGSHFGILSYQDVADPARYQARVDEAIGHWQDLSFYAQRLGLEYVYFETMSVPREMGHTIEEARALLNRVNVRVGVPMAYCLDAGHAPHPDQRDPYQWLSELGSDARIVHVHQTEQGHSRHWPFTEAYNAQGIIEPARVLRCLCEAGAEEVLIAFEIAHRERYEEEPKVVPELAASAAYWRRYLPTDGPWCPGQGAL